MFLNANFDTSLLNAAPTVSSNHCVLTSIQAEGPFFFPSPMRSDIREDRQGQDLDLEFQIVSHPDCSPVNEAIVEVWHCDAEGTYSGYPVEITHDIWKSAMFLNEHAKNVNGQMHVDPVNDNRFLRGRQKTNADGWVQFKSIFPGWYDGRVPHIHVKVITPDARHTDTQFYFDTSLCNEIFTKQSPYDKYGECPMPLEKDGVLAEGDSANGLLLEVKKSNTNPKLLNATAKIGLNQV